MGIWVREWCVNLEKEERDRECGLYMVGRRRSWTLLFSFCLFFWLILLVKCNAYYEEKL